jgi:hypothetical protein
MPNPEASGLEKALIILWGRLSNENQVEATLSLALLTLNLGRQMKEKPLEELGRSWLTIGSQDWLKENE